MSDIDQNQLEIAALKYCDLSYQDTEDDQIPLFEAEAAELEKDSKESINEAIRTILSNAKDNGICGQGHQRIVGILEHDRDASRIKLGPDNSEKYSSSGD